MFLVSQMPGLVKSFNTGILSHTLNVINVKLCMKLLLIKFYHFIPLSVNLTIFQDHSNVEQFYLILFCSYLVKLRVCRIVK